MATIINNWCDDKLLEVLKTKNGRMKTLGNQASKIATKGMQLWM